MKTIVSVLQDIEKLIYKVLLWIILIPKTIVQITLHPNWVRDYVAKELNPGHKPEEEHAPFDEYMSPVILLLVVALIPALVFNSLPTFGATISSSADAKPTTDRTLVFEALTDFKSASTEMYYSHTWTVEKVQADGSYIEIYRENHFPDSEKNFFEQIDSNTVKDRFQYTFPDLESGEYYINVYPVKYYPFQQDTPVIELYKAFLKVTVPLKSDEQIVISNDSAKSVAAQGDNPSIEDIVDQIQKENTIFLALALMIPPLLFTLAAKLFMGKQISETSLKESFYAQCYYFSPLSLAIWATYYAYFFFTADAYFFIGYVISLPILLMPPIMTALWFFWVETQVIAIERGVKGVKPFLIATVCVAILGFAVYVFFDIQNFQDRLRLLAIQTYPVLSAALALAFAIAWYRGQRAHNQGVTFANLIWVAASFVVLAVVLQFISFQGVSIPDAPPPMVVATNVAELPPVQQTQIAEIPTSTAEQVAYVPVFVDTPTPTLEMTPTPLVELPVTETPLIVVDTPTATPFNTDTPTPQPQPYYTEEFNRDVADWFAFMSSGDLQMAEKRVEAGRLSINLLPLDDKLPWFYLINNSFNYSDVKVEALVTNRSANATSVSLVCRYSDIGWYEFVFSSSGTYAIYAVDSVGIVSPGYNELISGDTPVINVGAATNVWTAECKGSELNLYVNQTLVRSVIDTKFNFVQGKIGLAVSSPEKLPVNVDFETFTVSEP